MDTATLVLNLVYVVIGAGLTWLLKPKQPTTPTPTPAPVVPAQPQPLSLGHGLLLHLLMNAGGAAGNAAMPALASIFAKLLANPSALPTIPINGVDPALTAALEQAAIKAILAAMTQQTSAPVVSPAASVPSTPVSVNLGTHTMTLADGSISLAPSPAAAAKA